MNAFKPHYDKLISTLNNEKLPSHDKPRVENAITVYKKWVTELMAVKGKPETIIQERVRLLNDYRLFIDLELIYDSEEDFLYRQKGQLKLDNSVIEEFLPFIANADVVEGLSKELQVGPANCFSAVYFEATLSQQVPGAGLHVRTKDQDFAISQKLYMKASHKQDFKDAAEAETFIAYVATEIKTNLDKTMFQEACATARDLKIAVPGAKYFLMAEWLDMTPISTAPTDIEQVLLLRGAKRLDSTQRKHFASSANRKAKRDFYKSYLFSHPFRADVLQRWIDNIKKLLIDETPEEKSVLQQGFF
jgi:hypothetical protein